MRSAAAFQLVIVPSSVLETIASSLDSTIAASWYVASWPRLLSCSILMARRCSASSRAFGASAARIARTISSGSNGFVR